MLTVRRNDEVRVSDAKKVYLQLELPVTGDVGAALFKHNYYQVPIWHIAAATRTGERLMHAQPAHSLNRVERFTNIAYAPIATAASPRMSLSYELGCS